MAKQVKTLTDDPRYLAFVERYAFDCTRFAVEVCQLTPTHHQVELFDSVSEPGSRTSASSGHGTGKTSGFAIIAVWHMLCYFLSNTYLTAPKLATVAEGVWKEFADLSAKIETGPHAWIREYFVIEAERVYVRGYKANWFIIAKTAPRGSPENLAGSHRDWLLWLADEASGIPDANFGVITGALTDARNRMCLASQPTRSSGFFYETHHKLSRAEGGVWNNLVFNSEFSPIVSAAFIAEKKAQYTEEEYQIKVQGLFPENSSKYLIGRKAIEACIGRQVIKPDEPYGWLLPVDVGGGGYRDDSVIPAFKVTGQGEYGPDARRAQLVSVPLMSNKQDPAQLHGLILEEARKRENSGALIDAGGMGLLVCKQLDLDGFTNYRKVLWGAPNFRSEYKERYFNQRAQAICGLTRAVQEGRFGVNADVPKSFVKKMVEQGSRIPYHYDEKARRVIAKKEDMRKEGIPSPDVWDACSFVFLEDAHYSLTGDSLAPMSSAKEAAKSRLKEQLAAARAGSPA
ncbi:hypothetical protein [Cupriavidus sp. Marseille-Q8015]